MQSAFPLPLPDDPRKWDGWSKYKSSNLYERLCLDPKSNPSSEIIETHCRELLRWWQKKLPLKNQPSNPLSQLLRPGLDESSQYLTQARVELLDPTRRKEMDTALAAQAFEEAIAEFHKYLAFALEDGVLTAEEENSLRRFGADHGLSENQITRYIELELRKTGAKHHRSIPPPSAPVVRPTENPNGAAAGTPREEFVRMLRLSTLDTSTMSDATRDAFINMAESLGLDPGDAEDMVDDYLEEADQTDLATQPSPPSVQLVSPRPPPSAVQTAVPTPKSAEVNKKPGLPFTNSLGGEMLFVPAGEFTMGSEATYALPNEQPLTKISLSGYFMSRHLVTNAEYEQFDPAHARKRAAGAGDRHPVIYVSSLEAIKFCQSLSARERKRYRLPTEAEWEYGARGTDGRKYPWGNYEGRGDLANFADRNTHFAWSDPKIDDGYAETSPVGSYPRSASPFGMLDLAGNVWEWCLDYFEPYRGKPKTNPRGPATGAKRVCRGGSWKSRFDSLRTTVRSANVPTYSCNDLGFRIVAESD